MAAKYARITSKSRMLHVTYRLSLGQRSHRNPPNISFSLLPLRAMWASITLPRYLESSPKRDQSPPIGLREAPKMASRSLLKPMKIVEKLKKKKQKEPMFTVLSSNLSSLCVVIDPQGKSILLGDSYGFLHWSLKIWKKKIWIKSTPKTHCRRTCRRLGGPKSNSSR